MKIAILTMTLLDNYGGILQNLALQNVLKNLGHQPETIYYNHIPKKLWKKMLRKHYKYLFLFPPRRKKYPHPSIYEKPFSNLLHFVKNNIRISEPMSDIEDYVWEKGRYDAFVVGSDQVWRPKYSTQKVLEAMFLNNLDNKEIPCIAYAASFGVDHWEFSPENTEIARRGVRKFRAVSVREKSGIELCRNYLGKEALLTLDPTMLMDKDFYKSFVNKKNLDAVHQESLGIYILDDDPQKEKAVTFLSEKLGKPIYRIENNNDKLKAPVESWLALFLKAGYIITDSFHGVVFAINFNIPFTVIDNPNRGSARIDSILDLFDLNDRRDIHNFSKKIDWTNVNRKKKEMREVSVRFLKENLK